MHNFFRHIRRSEFSFHKTKVSALRGGGGGGGGGGEAPQIPPLHLKFLSFRS